MRNTASISMLIRFLGHTKCQFEWIKELFTGFPIENQDLTLNRNEEAGYIFDKELRLLSKTNSTHFRYTFTTIEARKMRNIDNADLIFLLIQITITWPE